jgi:cytidylate kinase
MSPEIHENTDVNAANSIVNVVAIDGPAGVGKSTVARRVAAALGLALLDTGAMYRAATWWAMRQDVDFRDAGALARATESMPLRLEETAEGLRVFVNGEDVTRAIRGQDVTERIRLLDGIPRVRARLVALQRRFGAERPCVVEGRDIGTVVFPRAKCKIFLDASIEARTERRARQLEAAGEHVDRNALRDAIIRRDENDRTRALAPLRPAPDAVVLDTTEYTLDEVVEAIVRRARETL